MVTPFLLAREEFAQHPQPGVGQEERKRADGDGEHDPHGPVEDRETLGCSGQQGGGLMHHIHGE